MNLYFSLGTSTADKKTGSPNISIASGVATFDAAQTGNIVSGDKVVYDTSSSCYLGTKISTTQWNVLTAMGGTPSDVSNKTVNSIKRTFNSLMDLSGTPSSTALYALLGSSLDLVMGTWIVNIVLCNDGTDTVSTGILSSSWITNSSYHFNIFTPIDTTLHCNQTNRTNYVEFSTQGYRIETTLYNNTFEFLAPYTVIDGIVTQFVGTNRFYGIGLGNNCKLKNSIIADHAANLYCNTTGLTITIENCLIHGITESPFSTLGLILNAYGNTWNIYNCTLFIPVGVDTYIVFDYWCDNLKFKNCNLYCMDGRIQRPGNTCINSGNNSTNNSAYYKGTSGNNGVKDLTLGNFAFANTTSGSVDLRIGAGSSCINVGVGQAVDANVPSPDIDGASRTGSDCDTGINEFVPQGHPMSARDRNIPFDTRRNNFGRLQFTR